MAFNINDIRANLVGGGARSSHFQVIISNPFVPLADIKVPFMVKATSEPTFTLGKIAVPYFGRTVNIPGDRVWEDWQTTVMNDEDHIVKDALETWQNTMNAFRRNIATNGANPNNYKSTGIINKFSKTGDIIRVIQLNGLWPYIVQSIELDWATTDTIQEYQVTWAFDDLEIIGGTTGDAGGS